MLGARLRELRRDRHLTQMALAAKAGIAQSYLSDLERGIEENPSREVSRAIAIALQVSAKELAGAAWADEMLASEPLPLASVPEPLARALQSVGSLLDDTSWELVAAYIKGIAAER